MRRSIVLLLLLVPWALSCEPEPEPEPEPEREPCLDPGRNECVDHVFLTCVDGFWEETQACASPTPQCSVSLGCIGCGAGQDYCVDNAVYHCNDAGSDWAMAEDCGDRTCRWGQCFDPCELAEEENSYLGCEFLAVPTANNELEFSFENDFAVVVGNPDDQHDAEVRIVRDGQMLATEVVGSGTTRAITLPYLSQLKASDMSVIVRGGAYEVLSDIPVVAYQYNPLDFSTGGVYSYTNDASLLLPVVALGKQHLVSTWPTWGINQGYEWMWSPGFVTVAAAFDGTHVYLTSSAYTLGGDIAAMSPGQSTEVILDRGDVLQVFSEKGDPWGSCSSLEGALSGNAPSWDWDYPVCLDVLRGDLTGSWVNADQPIAVFAGHNCTFVPFDAWACDHLEESVLPIEVWGMEAVVSAPVMPGMSGPAPTLVRVLAQHDGTEITFVPAVHEPAIAGPNQVVELTVYEDVVVRAATPIVVTQLLLGEQELGVDAGDPAMGTMPPSNHWRSAYEFLVPSTYQDDYVNLVARQTARVYLDDVEVIDWTPIEDTPYHVHRAHLLPGPHSAHSDGGSPFSLVAYGYADYTSYLYPGGLDLTHNPQP
jgi:hypothetical protein